MHHDERRHTPKGESFEISLDAGGLRKDARVAFEARTPEAKTLADNLVRVLMGCGTIRLDLNRVERISEKEVASFTLVCRRAV
jgi:hypothetical protein